jgi:hypothetical protein
MERSARNEGLKDPGDLWACQEEAACYNTTAFPSGLRALIV